MSDGRDNAWARLEARMAALEDRIAAAEKALQERASFADAGGPVAPGTGGGKDTLHVPRKVPAWKESA